MNLDSLFGIDVKLYNFLLIPKRIYARVKYASAFKAAKRNSELLKKEKKSDVLYICGNGPSLRKVDLNDIDCDYIVVNDEIHNAADRIMAIIRAEHAKTFRSIHEYLKLIEEEKTNGK